MYVCMYVLSVYVCMYSCLSVCMHESIRIQYLPFLIKTFIAENYRLIINLTNTLIEPRIYNKIPTYLDTS